MNIDKNNTHVRIFSAYVDELATLEHDVNSFIAKYVSGDYEIQTCATVGGTGNGKMIITIIF